jgi:Arc/MetJ-type ribon-helix-helix transcriptional regulator
MPKRTVRIHPELDQRMLNAAKERGYRTPSAFIRAAIESEIKSRDEKSGMEEQAAASFDRLAKEQRRILRGQQALFALVDALTKAFLTCVPEPQADAMSQSVARARDRYARLLRAAGYAMGSEVRSAMQSLVENGDD